MYLKPLTVAIQRNEELIQPEHRTQRERRQPRAEMPKPVSVVESREVTSRDWGEGKRGMTVNIGLLLRRS